MPKTARGDSMHVPARAALLNGQSAEPKKYSARWTTENGGSHGGQGGG